MAPPTVSDTSSGIESRALEELSTLTKRIQINLNVTSTSDQVAASTQDPWSQSSKYALGWVYFSVVLVTFTILLHLYHVWGDKNRTALYKEEYISTIKTFNPIWNYEMTGPPTTASTRPFFKSEDDDPNSRPRESSIANIRLVNYFIAFMRWIVYRPMPVLKLWKLQIEPPSTPATVIVAAAFIFVTLYCFIPQPLYYFSIRDGSPPLAIRAGMIAVALMPWITVLSTKANLVSMLTGIGSERLNVLHRWGGYLCLFLSLIHMIPFYITPIWEDNALSLYQPFISNNIYVYGTGIAAIVPLGFLCIHSLPFLRSWMYELFVALHTPAAVIFLAMLFWHCKNFLTSWHYLFVTVGIWVLSYLMRLVYLNWANPFRLSWLIGEESAITLLPENAIKVTIPTQTRWRPGQFVYLRMPGISFFENHPFTIASLCSDDFPSSYGEDYRDMALIFRPFRGFTGKVLNAALVNGPFKTYRAFIDGPYGGMKRDMAAFDHVIFFAGGSGITATASQLLDLIRRMRDGKALTKTVRVVWAMKRPEILEWFKEELRICQQYAPAGSVFCQIHLTGGGRFAATPSPQLPLHNGMIRGKMKGVFSEDVTDKKDPAIFQETEMREIGDTKLEKELRREQEDIITELPSAYLAPSRSAGLTPDSFSLPRPAHRGENGNFNFDISSTSTPNSFQRNLTPLSLAPLTTQERYGWTTEHGRPNIPFLLKQFSTDFGRRTCVFVCGPPSMRVEVSRMVASLQRRVMSDPSKDELFLHTENYAI